MLKNVKGDQVMNNLKQYQMQLLHLVSFDKIV